MVEAGLRSGAANTDRVGTAPRTACVCGAGPVTSSASAGCHELIRGGATPVTPADQIIEIVSRIGELADEPTRPAARSAGDAGARRSRRAVGWRRKLLSGGRVAGACQFDRWLTRFVAASRPSVGKPLWPRVHQTAAPRFIAYTPINIRRFGERNEVVVDANCCSSIRDCDCWLRFTAR